MDTIWLEMIFYLHIFNFKTFTGNSNNCACESLEHFSLNAGRISDLLEATIWIIAF